MNLANIFIIYALLTGNSYQACHQKVGGAVVCTAMAASPHQLTLEDDALYDIWVKVNGTDSDKLSWRTQKKTPSAPSVVER